jgi:hypothetical protein
MIAMNMRQHYDIDFFRINSQLLHVVEQHIAVTARVKEDDFFRSLNDTGKTP